MLIEITARAVVVNRAGEQVYREVDEMYDNSSDPC